MVREKRQLCRTARLAMGLFRLRLFRRALAEAEVEDPFRAAALKLIDRRVDDLEAQLAEGADYVPLCGIQNHAQLAQAEAQLRQSRRRLKFARGAWRMRLESDISAIRRDLQAYEGRQERDT